MSQQERNDYLHVIQRETTRMNALVHDLLDLSQLQSETLTMTKSPLVLAQLINETLDVLAISIAKKRLTVSANLDEDIIMNANELRLKQVFYNLIHNAIRYTNAEGHIDISLSHDENKVDINVTDTGIGISKADLSRLGERFFRADKARTRDKGGTGLGLAISKEIIHYHDGTLNFKSNLGQGTTVTITFPYESFQ